MAEAREERPNVIPSITPDVDDRIRPLVDTPPLPDGGHCLFTVGAVQAGKSTLQHALIHRLYTDERIVLTFRNEDGATFQDPDLQDWIFRFDRGEFPERTPRGALQTFFIEFGQSQRKAKLSFVELSGEHFQALLPRRNEPDHAPQLDTDLEHILTTQTVKKLFIFLADTTRHDRTQLSQQSEDERSQDLFEDMMFSCLLNRLRVLGLSRIRLLFAATKWDAAPDRNLDPERFFRAHFPQTRAALRRFPKAQVQYIRFSIGTVHTKSPDSSSQEGNLEIAKRDLVPIERVIQWVYTHSTGKALKGYPTVQLSLWQKVKWWAAT